MIANPQRSAVAKMYRALTNHRVVVQDEAFHSTVKDVCLQRSHLHSDQGIRMCDLTPNVAAKLARAAGEMEHVSLCGLESGPPPKPHTIAKLSDCNSSGYDSLQQCSQCMCVRVRAYVVCLCVRERASWDCEIKLSACVCVLRL